MKLRPRYSLLTLLVLTALVASVTGLVVIGVKRWHGPHRVIERTNANEEKEYTYTRDWHRNHVIQGPMVIRRFQEQNLVYFAVIYFRQGKNFDWIYQSSGSSFQRDIDFSETAKDCPLSAAELRDFHQARDVESQRLTATEKIYGKRSKGKRYEGVENFVIIGGGKHMRVNQWSDIPGD